jgi:hypothetical protein
MIDRILVSPDGEEVIVVMGDSIKVADPHEEYGEFVDVDHVAEGWSEVYSRG